MSKYIRIKFADDEGYANCVTCGITKHWKELQAGHFVPKAQGLGVYFIEENLAPQCFRCNVNLGSNGPMYYRYMLDTYGQETIDWIILRSNQVFKYSVEDYENMISEYTEKLEDVARHKGIDI